MSYSDTDWSSIIRRLEEKNAELLQELRLSTELLNRCVTTDEFVRVLAQDIFTKTMLKDLGELASAYPEDVEKQTDLLRPYAKACVLAASLLAEEL